MAKQGCISQSEGSTTQAITASKETLGDAKSQQIGASKVSVESEMKRVISANVAHNKSSSGIVSHVSSMSLNVGRRRTETIFKINKGVKVFDFSFEKNLLITGG